MVASFALLLSLIAVSQAQLFPPGQELVYKYHGHVWNSVEKPALYSTQFLIDTIVNVKSFKDGCLFQFLDTNYTTHIGKGETFDETVVKPIPSVANDVFSMPFYVKYLEGKALKFYSAKEDLPWSLNMKQSLAFLLQLNYSQIETDKLRPYAFHSEEQTVHGPANVMYDVIPHNSTSVTFKKWIKSGKNFKWDINFNIINTGYCEEDFDKSLERNGITTFELEYLNKEYSIKHIENNNYVMFYPINGNGGAHSIHSRQILELLSSKPTDAVVELDNFVLHELISPLQTHENNIVGNQPDLTLGRHKIDINVVMPKMREKLDRVVEYMKVSHVTLKEPNFRQGQSVHDLLIYLRHFDLQNLEHCFNILSEVKNTHQQGMFEVYQQILPYIGTHASNIFIKKLIESNKVKDEMALHMVKEYPFYTIFPDTMLVKNLVETTRWRTDIAEEIRKTAILSFATLLSRVLKTDPKNIELNRYIGDLTGQYVRADNYSTQLLYLGALQNLQSPQIFEIFEPMMLKVELKLASPQLRSNILYALTSTHIKQPMLAKTMYWPILLNKDETLEMRCGALDILMTSTKMMDQWKIFWFMMTEPDEDLFNYYYTKLTSTASMVSPCYHTSSINYKRLLQYMRRVPKVSTGAGVYTYDYFNSPFNMGAVMKLTHIGNLLKHRSTTLIIQDLPHISNLMVNQQTIYLRVSISKTFRDALISNMKTSNSLFDLYSSIIESDINIKSPEDFHLEYSSVMHNQVVSIQYYNKPSVLKTLIEGLQSTMGGLNDVKYKIGQVVDLKLFFPMDMGLTMSIFVNMPTVGKSKFMYDFNKHKDSNIMNVKFVTDTMKSTFQTYGMDIFNPFTNTWHGSRRILTSEYHLPLSIDLSLNVPQSSIKVSFNKGTNPGNFGFQAFVQSQVYTFDENTLEFDQIEAVTNGPEYKTQSTIFDMDMEDVGLRLKVMVFDCERIITPSRLIQLRKEFLSNYNKNWGKLPVMKLLLAARYWWSYVTFSAYPGMCGMGFQVTSSPKCPATHADLTMRFATNEGSTLLVPITKYNYRATYNLKNEDKVVRSWDLHIMTDVVLDGVTDMDIAFTRVKPEVNDYKVCLNGKLYWKDESMKGLYTLLAGDAVENKCPQDQTKITATMSTKPSSYQYHPVQKDKFEIGIHDTIPYTMDHTSIRHYMYDIHYVNVSKSIMDLYFMWRELMHKESGYQVVKFEPTNLSEGSLKMNLDYPIASKNVNLHIVAPSGTYTYEDIPISDWYWTNLVRPYSSHISTKTFLQYMIGYSYSCGITAEYYVNQFVTQKVYPMPEKWTLYAAEGKEKPLWEIYVKKVEGAYPLAVRIVNAGDNFDIYNKDDLQFFHNNNQLETSHGFHSIPWMNYKVISEEHSVYIHLPEYGIIMDYNGQTLNVQLPFKMQNTGLCYELP